MRNANFGSKNSSPQWKPLRVLGILFCLIVFTAGLAGAAGADGIVITDTTFTPPGNAAWSYDSTNHTGTLTLNDGTWDNITVSDIDIYNLIIVLAGENKITGGYTNDNGDIYGIYVPEGTLTIKSDGTTAGSLNVTVSGSGPVDVYGIYAKKSTSADSIEIESGKVEVNVTGSEAYGIYADSGILDISGGEVNVTVNGGSQAFGIYANDSSANSEFTDIISITKSKVTTKASALTATGIYSKGKGRFFIGTGGIVTAEANGTNSAKGIYAYEGNIVNNEGTVKATATTNPGDAAYGLYATSPSSLSGFGIIRIGMYSLETTAVGSTKAIDARSLGGSHLSIQARAEISEGELSSVIVDADIIDSLSSYKYVVITILDSSTDPSNPGSPDNSHPSSGSAGDGRYYSFPRTTENGGSVTFGKSPVVTEIILPQGSKGSVVLAVESVEDWPGIEQTPYAFEITAPEKADGISEILFRVELSELERLEAQPEGIGIFVKKGDDWMPLLSVFELGEKYVYYTVETDTLGEFEIRFEEGGAVSGETEEPVEPETPADPVIPDEPQEVLPPIEPPVKDEEPKSPMPILAVLAGLSAATALRRK